MDSSPAGPKSARQFFPFGAKSRLRVYWQSMSRLSAWVWPLCCVSGFFLLSASGRYGLAQAPHCLQLALEESLVGFSANRIAQDQLQSVLVFRKANSLPGAALRISPIDSHWGTGDFFKMVGLGKGRVAVFMGDVQGHGDRPAAVTLAMHGQMRSAGFQKMCRRPGVQAHELLEHLDRTSKFENERQFALAVLVVDSITGNIEYASAGMPPVFVRRADGRVEMVEAVGSWVGEDPFMSYSVTHEGSVSRKLAPGDSVVLVTDGLMEPQRASGQGAAELEYEAAFVRQLRKQGALVAQSPETFLERLFADMEVVKDDRMGFVWTKQ